MPAYSKHIQAGANQYLDGLDGFVFDGDLDQDFTMEWWLHPDSLPTAGNEVILFRADGTTGLADEIILIKIINDAGTLKFFAHIQENDTASPPAADQHCDVEFDISALVSASTWEYLALTMDISALVASKFELFHGDEVTSPTSQGNGTVVSGTDCVSIPSPIGDMWIFGNGAAGKSFDGKVFRWYVWSDIRTPAELADNYLRVFVGPEGNMTGSFWSGGRHDGGSADSAQNDLVTIGGVNTFVADIPAGMQAEDLNGISAAQDGIEILTGPMQKYSGYRSEPVQAFAGIEHRNGPTQKYPGYRAGANQGSGGEVYLLGSTAASAGTGTTFPPLQTDQKSQFLSTEPLEIALQPFVSAITGQFILGTDSASVQVVKPDNTLYGTPPTLTWDSGIERWKGEISIAAFQEGEWLLYFTSDDPNAIPQWLMLWWGDYMDDVPEIRQAALGRWRIIGTQLVLYEDDLTTVFRTFDLRDSLGNPSSANIFDKDPVP